MCSCQCFYYYLQASYNWKWDEWVCPCRNLLTLSVLAADQQRLPALRVLEQLSADLLSVCVASFGRRRRRSYGRHVNHSVYCQCEQFCEGTVYSFYFVGSLLLVWPACFISHWLTHYCSSQIKKDQDRIINVLESKKIPFKCVDISQNNADKDMMRKMAGNPAALPPQICKGEVYCGVSCPTRKSN